MSYMLSARNEFDGLSKLLHLIIENGKPNGNYLEILSCLLTIVYDADSLVRFRAFRNEFLDITRRIGGEGWNRATRVYTTMRDLPTKPSYLRRLIEYPDKPRLPKISTPYINQIDTITSELAKKPGFSTLSFIFLRPADLIDKFRPGYVPCPIAGDFKFRDGKLHLSVMFRTSDAFGVGYADIFYLRQIQEMVLQRAKEKTLGGKIQDSEIGDLNLFFSRTYVEKNHYYKDKDTKTNKSIKVIPLVKQLLEALNNPTL